MPPSKNRGKESPLATSLRTQPLENPRNRLAFAKIICAFGGTTAYFSYFLYHYGGSFKKKLHFP